MEGNGICGGRNRGRNDSDDRCFRGAAQGNARICSYGCAGSRRSSRFFLMGLAVQKVAGSTNEDFARRAMTVSYRYRTLMQLLWCVLAFALPVFNAAAGIIPLFIPSVLIKARGILLKGKGRKPSAGEERVDIHKEQQDGETKEVDAQV